MKTVMHIFFEELELNGIKYCHFKSNEHLGESFEGISDFDVLVDSDKKDQTTDILIKTGAKNFESPYINNYPNIENWLFFDANSGIIYHLHLHYHLLTGTAHVKEYEIEWADNLLDTAIRDINSNIFISNPNWELVLLFTRIFLKTDWKAYAKIRVKMFLNKYSLSKGIRREFEWLLDRIDRTVFTENLKSVYDGCITDVIEKCVDERKISAVNFRKLYSLFKKQFKNKARLKKNQILKQNYEQISYTKKAKKYKKKGKFIIAKKVNNKGGLAISFIGVDGSGKSTVTKDITKWLDKKIDCQNLYLGAGAGVRNKKIKFLKKISRGFKRFRFTKLATIFEAKSICAVTKNNKKNLLKMAEYRKQGGICIMDRFPQFEKPGVNDGIKIEEMLARVNNGYMKKLALREKENMQVINDVYPDLIFRLNITIETCMNRKEEHKDKEAYQRKLNDVGELKYSLSRLIEIDAEQSYEDEVLEIKRMIWEAM